MKNRESHKVVKLVSVLYGRLVTRPAAVTRQIIVPTYGRFPADSIRHLIYTVYPNVPFLTARFYLYY